jgi:hypothetical protein
MIEEGKPDVHLATWAIWILSPEEEARSWRFKCNTCGEDLNLAVVFPLQALRICPRCVSKIHDQLINQAPSSDPGTGSVSCSVPTPSRSDTLKEV